MSGSLVALPSAPTTCLLSTITATDSRLTMPVGCTTWLTVRSISKLRVARLLVATGCGGVAAGCCFGAGLNQSVVAPFPAVPNGTSVISIFGDVGVTTWERVADRLITEVGQCANSFSPPGACNVYVGIWAPAAWSAYVAGGPLDPLWCYSAGATCLNFSGGSLSSPNLQTLDGVHGEIVIWNLAPYQLVGQYEVDIYTSVPG